MFGSRLVNLYLFNCIGEIFVVTIHPEVFSSFFFQYPNVLQTVKVIMCKNIGFVLAFFAFWRDFGVLIHFLLHIIGNSGRIRMKYGSSSWLVFCVFQLFLFH